MDLPVCTDLNQFVYVTSLNFLLTLIFPHEGCMQTTTSKWTIPRQQKSWSCLAAWSRAATRGTALSGRSRLPLSSPIVGDFCGALLKAHGDPAPLSANTSITRGKTCFIPVYFRSWFKSQSLSRVVDVDTLTALVQLTSTWHFRVKVTRFTSSTDFHFLPGYHTQKIPTKVNFLNPSLLNGFICVIN